MAKTGFDGKEYSTVAREIDNQRERMKKLKGEQTERALRNSWGKELQDFLKGHEEVIRKFDKEMFRKFVEKVRVRSIVEVEFVFKAGVEQREILG